MKLLTLLAGYAAGLAVAMKYRKNAGTSKLKVDPKKSKMDAFIDEVVDIHKSAYDEVKGFVVANFDDVKDPETLKSKVSSLLDGVLGEAESYISKLKTDGVTKKEMLEEKVDAFFEGKEAILSAAKEKGKSFTDTATENILVWIEQARVKLHTLRDTVKSEIEKKTPTKKSPTKKTVAKKKSPTKKTPNV